MRHQENKQPISISNQVALRSRAEKIVSREASFMNGMPVREEETVLLHNLRVHQIQLEMQNEELQRARLESDKVRDQYHKLFDLAPVGFILVNAKGMILKANHTVAYMLGVKHSQLARTPLLPFIGQRHRNLYLGRFSAFFAKPENKNIVLQLVRSKGSFFWGRITGQRLKGSEVFGETCREPDCLLISITDITDQMRLQEKLTAVQRELDQIFNAAVPVCLIGTDYVINRVNDTCSNLMGTPKDELEGKKCFEVWPGPYCHTDNCSLQRVLSGTQRWGIEKTITVFSHCREQKKSCLVEATPFLDENGKICGIVESIIDISDRKKAESALLESEERFRGIVENASDLIQTVSAHGFILFVNNAWRATLGYTEEEVRKFHFHDICHPDYLEYCLEVFSKVIAGENITKVETVFLTKNGSEIIVEGKVNLQNDSSGMPMAVRGIFRDITVRKTLEKKLQHKCITDELTDTLNRRGFMEMASRYHNLAKRDSLRYSLLYLDLDNMKTINDDLGHKIGDQALIDLATFLKGMFRQSDLVARMGGDEFVVLLASDLHPNGAKSIVGRIEKSAQNFCQQHGRPYMLRISIGAARFVPGEKRTIEDLLAKADHAMYAVKQKRKGIRS